jgi:hypothetical protein
MEVLSKKTKYPFPPVWVGLRAEKILMDSLQLPFQTAATTEPDQVISTFLLLQLGV